MTDENHTPKKRYGLTDERKRRKAEYARELYEQIPWHLPMNAWDSIDISVYNEFHRRTSMEELAEAEKRIKDRQED